MIVLYILNIRGVEFGVCDEWMCLMSFVICFFWICEIKIFGSYFGSFIFKFNVLNEYKEKN